MLSSGYVLAPIGNDGEASGVVTLSQVSFGAIKDHIEGRGFVETQCQLVSSLRAKFSDTREEVKGLTSRTKNLFVEKSNLAGDAVNDAVVKTWVDDLVKAAEGSGGDGWAFVGEKEGVTIPTERVNLN